MYLAFALICKFVRNAVRGSICVLGCLSRNDNDDNDDNDEIDDNDDNVDEIDASYSDGARLRTERE